MKSQLEKAKEGKAVKKTNWLAQLKQTALSGEFGLG
jgi:hypothetical protein